MKTLSLLALSLALVGGKALDAKVSEIRDAPPKFDGKAVTVKGKVASFKQKTSKAGNGYYTFDLVDGKERLSIYGGDKLDPAVKDGDEVAVTGRFAAKRTVGEHTFENEVDASSKLDKAFGVKSLSPAK